MATKQQYVERALALCRVPASTNETKRLSILQNRLAGLGYGQYCSRCGGGGHYSFNLTDGTICFRCHGTGYQSQPITAALIARLEADEAAGKIETYLAERRRRAMFRKSAASATAKVMAAWTASGVSEAYHWQDAATGKEPDETISHRFNAPMCALYNKVQQLTLHMESVGHKRVQTTEERSDRDHEVDRLAEEVAREADAAVQEIEGLASELGAFLKEQAM